MLFPLTLPQAAHELAEPVVAWQAEFVDSQPPSVKLTASIQSDPVIPIFPIQGPTATTLAIQMDARVAITLAAQLRDLARSVAKADFDAQEIDVHLTEDGRAAMLTIVRLSPDQALSVRLPRAALERLRDRISRALSASTPPPERA